MPTIRYGLDDPCPKGIPESAWQELQELRHHVLALDQYAYNQRPDGSRSFFAVGGSRISPAPHNYLQALAHLVERCLEVKRGLKVAVSGLALPDPPQIVAELCDNRLQESDPRRWLGFKGTIEKLNEWVNQVRSAVRARLADPPTPAVRKGKPATGTRRRRTTPRKPTPLTPSQTEAVLLVAEHKGNVAAAARAAGKSRAAMKKLYDKALKKVGARALKHLTQRLPTDKRGQELIAAEEE